MQKLSIKNLLDDTQEITLQTLRHISHADLAYALLDKRQDNKEKLFQLLLDFKLAVPVLSEMKEIQLKKFLRELPKETLIPLFSEGPMDDLVYMIDFVPQKEELLEALPVKQKNNLKKFMAYPEDSAGRIMQDDYFAIPPTASVEQGVEKLREYARQKFVHYIYSTDQENVLQGVLSIRQLAISEPKTQIKDILNKNVISIKPQQSAKAAANIVSRHNFIAVPVIDEENKVLGLITVDDVLDIIQESATAKIYAMAGLPEGDRIYTKSSTTIKNRLPWLSINLIFAVLASSIISLFEQTMGRLIILATLKNIVAGIGGNTAIQTLTVTTRGLEAGDFNFTNIPRALAKETISGLTTGCVMGLGAGLITYFWKSSLLVACIIFLAMVFNSLMAVWAGFATPLIMKRLKKDPAISSGVIVTVITDIFGFFVFLGMASAALKFFGESL